MILCLWREKDFDVLELAFIYLFFVAALMEPLCAWVRHWRRFIHSLHNQVFLKEGRDGSNSIERLSFFYFLVLILVGEIQPADKAEFRKEGGGCEGGLNGFRDVEGAGAQK